LVPSAAKSNSDKSQRQNINKPVKQIFVNYDRRVVSREIKSRENAALHQKRNEDWGQNVTVNTRYLSKNAQRTVDTSHSRRIKYFDAHKKISKFLELLQSMNLSIKLIQKVTFHRI
jgi:hypothetical protein